MNEFEQRIADYHDIAAADVHDVDGNNALMIACFHGQTQIAAKLLIRQPNIVIKNSQNKTPLMAAIQSRSIDTMRMLLQNSAVVRASLDSVDCFGNTAALLASNTNNLDILQTIMQHSNLRLLDQINRKTGDTALHIAARNGASMDFIMYIMHHVTNPKLAKRKNHKGETFYHLCENLVYIKCALEQHPGIASIVINQIDNQGRSPLMAWAAKGRLDLVETMIPYTKDYSRVDKDGRTILHLLALHLGRHFTFTSEKSFDCIVKKMKCVVNVRDWCHGNTALHIAAETSTLASSHSTLNAAAFIKALVKHGAALNAANLRNEHPVNICRIPELMTCLDGK